MKFGWDPKKARSNLRKHKVSFEEAATALKDPMSATGLDPDHSVSEERFVTFGVSERGRLLIVAHTEKMILFVSSAHAKRAKERGEYMKKVSQTDKDELRAEYKRSDFPDGFIRGKYASRIRESSNIVVLNPEVAEAFPNEEAVNSALQSLIKLAQKTTRPKKRSTGDTARGRDGS